jgi:hypothetical protein
MYKRPVEVLAYSTSSFLLRRRAAAFSAQRFREHTTYSYRQLRATEKTRRKPISAKGCTRIKASDAILSEQQAQIEVPSHCPIKPAVR